MILSFFIIFVSAFSFVFFFFFKTKTEVTEDGQTNKNSSTIPTLVLGFNYQKYTTLTIDTFSVGSQVVNCVPVHENLIKLAGKVMRAHTDIAFSFRIFNSANLVE